MAGKDHLGNSPDDGEQRVSEQSSAPSGDADAANVDKKFDISSKKQAARAFVAAQLGIDVEHIATGRTADGIAIRIQTDVPEGTVFPTEFEGIPLDVRVIGEIRPL